MKKFKITYIEGDTINKTEIVEAEAIVDALVVFTMSHLNINDIAKVEEVTE